MYRTDLLVDDTNLQFKLLQCDKSDASLIALKCPQCVFCIRGRLQYQHYRKVSRDGCPTICALY